MGKVLTATWDGSVFRPDEPLDLEANSRARLTVEKLERTGKPADREIADRFLRAAGSWKALIHCDRLAQDIYESRQVQTGSEPRT